MFKCLLTSSLASSSVSSNWGGGIYSYCLGVFYKCFFLDIFGNLPVNFNCAKIILKPKVLFIV